MTNYEGWAPMHGTQRSFHYYREGRALCGRWAILPHMAEHLPLTPGDESILRSSGADCLACTKKRRAEVAAVIVEKKTP